MGKLLFLLKHGALAIFDYGLSFMILFSLYYLLAGPVFKYSHIWGYDFNLGFHGDPNIQYTIVFETNRI